MSTPATSRFADALRFVRKAKGLTQEDFDAVTSRVYVSALERGRKQPTLATVETLASVMGVHPLTLLAASYCKTQNGKLQGLDELLELVSIEGKSFQGEGA